MIPSREPPFDRTRRGRGALPRTPAEGREFDAWLLDISRRPYATSGCGIDLVGDGRPGVGDVARTTVAWSVSAGLPVQHGMVTRLAWSDEVAEGLGATETRIVFFVPQGASLLPPGGVWLPAAAVELDDHLDLLTAPDDHLDLLTAPELRPVSYLDDGPRCGKSFPRGLLDPPPDITCGLPPGHGYDTGYRHEGDGPAGRAAWTVQSSGAGIDVHYLTVVAGA